MSTSRRAWKHRPVLSALALSLAASTAFAYPAWQPDTFYVAGTIVTYNGTDYMAVVNQTDYVATGWNPTLASLWQAIGATGGGGSSGGGTGSDGSGGSSGGGGAGSGGTGGGSNGGSAGGACASAWSATNVYTGGATASVGAVNYTANYWSQGADPSVHNGGAGSGEPWTSNGNCSGGSSNPPTNPPDNPPPNNPPSNPPPSGPPPSGFSFSPYKDITISMNWNTNVISSAVTGTLQPVLTVMPSHLTTLTWGFATGECGTENWAGLPGPAVAAANVQNFVSNGKYYILSTGGAAGAFRCGSDAGFDTFIRRYYSSNMLGVDFDIEAGQSAADIANLVQRVIVAKRNFPNLRFSFTIATLGGNAAQSLNATGVAVINAIRSAGLTGYTINLMTMDFGSTNPANCVVVSGKCDMAQSAMAAAENLHTAYGIPYNQIEVTPMIGGNDTIDETFTLGNVATLVTYVRQKNLAGLHFWSFDRDTDCAPGYASPICNSYGTAGRLGFTMQFLSSLGL